MTKKILAIDPLAPRGHINFNKFYLNCMKGVHLKFVISRELSRHYDGLQDVVTFNPFLLNKGRFLHLIFSLFIVIKYLVYAKKNRYDIVFLFSYDYVAMFIISYFAKFLRIKIYAFEHNTIPENRSSKIFFQKICSSEYLERLCFTDSAVKQYRSIEQKAKRIKLPLIKFDDVIESERSSELMDEVVVFCPSASADLRNVEMLSKRYPGFLFIIKANKQLKNENCICEPYFSDYQWLMCRAQFVYIPVNFTSRVSGPLYEAIGNNKRVIVEFNEFGRFAKSEFRGNVQFSNEPLNFDSKGELNVDSYNGAISDDISKLLWRTY